MADEGESLVPILTQLAASLTEMLKKEKDATADFRPDDLIMWLVDRGQISIEDVEKAVEEKTKHLATQKSVDDLDLKVECLTRKLGWIEWFWKIGRGIKWIGRGIKWVGKGVKWISEKTYRILIFLAGLATIAVATKTYWPTIDGWIQRVWLSWQ